jgi:hypothetical protein
MKRVCIIAMSVLALMAVGGGANALDKESTWGFPRDSPRFDRWYSPPCVFPAVPNPCAVPCRGPWIQAQAVPCGLDSACPALKLPCHGFAYGARPYPIFKMGTERTRPE